VGAPPGEGYPRTLGPKRERSVRAGFRFGAPVRGGRAAPPETEKSVPVRTVGPVSAGAGPVGGLRVQ